MPPSSTPLSIPDELRLRLVDRLETYRHLSDDTPDRGSTNGSGTTDSEQVLAAILNSEGKIATDDEVERAVDEYIGGKPLAYITGRHAFGGLDLTVRQPIYIPRVETEQWVLLLARRILDHAPEDRTVRVLDVCSGSGCIPLLLALEGGGRIETVGLDVDEVALEVARENARRNGIDRLCTFERLDLFSEDDVGRVRRELSGTFDLITCNPPYVSQRDMDAVEGRWHEGRKALQGVLRPGAQNDDDDDDDGYSFYRRILEIYHPFLSPDRPAGIPKLVLEIGSTQSRPVQDMYRDQGRMEVHKETPRRKDLSAPKLEHGDMVGTERSLWIYEQGR